MLALTTPAQADISAFLKARAAGADGALTESARRYTAALAGAPASVTVADGAFTQAVAAGDWALADRALAVLDAAGKAPVEAALQRVARAAAANDAPALDAAIARLAKGPYAVLAPSLAAWAALARGAEPLAPLDPPPTDAVARRLAAETRALVLIAAGRVGEGTTALLALTAIDAANTDVRVAAAQLLIGRGERERARALLVGDAAAVVALRRDPGAGARPSAAFGAARLFARVASDLAAGAPGPLQIAFAQAALRADSADHRARLLLADALAGTGAVAPALAALAAVPEGSPYVASARAGRVQVLAGAGRTAEALAAAAPLASAPDARDVDVRRYADLLAENGRPAEAVPFYARLTEGEGARDWSRWLHLGAALDEAGRWPEARAALERAVALAPDEPLALNYLGYARIERGEAVAASRAMLEKASRLDPADAAIADSLGWAYFKRGDTARALPLIERAAQGAPDNAVIGEHLGDAYWALGRRFEARYAWRAAALVADADERARLAAKLTHGGEPPR